MPLADELFSEACILLPRPGPNPIVMFVLGFGIGVWIVSTIWVLIWIKENGKEEVADADTP